MKKTHIVRIIITSLFTVFFIRMMLVRLQIDNYTLARIILDMKSYGVTSFSPEVAINLLILNAIWIGLITITVICSIWYFVALPPQIIPKIRFNPKPDNIEPIANQESPPSNNDLASSEGGDALFTKKQKDEDIEEKVDKILRGE